jgi:hypothetical protein
MTDTMAARLMSTMRGDGSRFEAPETKTDATTLALIQQGRGDTDYSYVHDENAKRQAEHDAAVRRRASELRAQGVRHPESAARMELQMAAQRAKEQSERRAVYDQMVTSNRAEMEANSTAGLRDRLKASTTQRREENTRRLVASLMAQLNASA